MEHGTLVGYNYWKCRCSLCRQAINDYTKTRHKTRLEKIWALKDEPCVDCGNKYAPWIMQFDHLGDEDKVDKISRMGTYSWKKVEEEIAKCDLVCANCHADRTYRRNFSEERSTLFPSE